MVGLLLLFALIHSGGAAIRMRAEAVIGARAWRVIFASASIPMAFVLISFFIAHRYDGIRIWNLQGVPGIIPVIWILTFISFLFLYPATYNLLEIPAISKPEVRLYSTGIIRITRHPQAFGQILWCISHTLWIGSSFMIATSTGLIAHHLFAIWHGDKRLKDRFGDDFDEVKQGTSIIPFLALIDGRQKLIWSELIKPAQIGIIIAVLVLWWAHHFIAIGSEAFLTSPLGQLLS